MLSLQKLKNNRHYRKSKQIDGIKKTLMMGNKIGAMLQGMAVSFS
jgi:hypothetical protein